MSLVSLFKYLGSDLKPTEIYPYLDEIKTLERDTHTSCRRHW